jgi:hypothetical protein
MFVSRCRGTKWEGWLGVKIWPRFLFFVWSTGSIHNWNHVRFEVVTAVSMKTAALWIIDPCSLVEVHRSFRSAYCAHHSSDGGSIEHQITWRINLQPAIFNLNHVHFPVHCPYIAVSSPGPTSGSVRIPSAQNFSGCVQPKSRHLCYVFFVCVRPLTSQVVLKWSKQVKITRGHTWTVMIPFTRKSVWLHSAENDNRCIPVACTVRVLG